MCLMIVQFIKNWLVAPGIEPDDLRGCRFHKICAMHKILGWIPIWPLTNVEVCASSECL